MAESIRTLSSRPCRNVQVCCPSSMVSSHARQNQSSQSLTSALLTICQLRRRLVCVLSTNKPRVNSGRQTAIPDTKRRETDPKTVIIASNCPNWAVQRHRSTVVSNPLVITLVAPNVIGYSANQIIPNQVRLSPPAQMSRGCTEQLRGSTSPTAAQARGRGRCGAPDQCCFRSTASSARGSRPARSIWKDSGGQPVDTWPAIGANVGLVRDT
jgi:hypothetical protein